jgi:hypothetical protein
VCLRISAYVEHQVDKWLKCRNSLDWVRCSWEGSLHASEGDFCQTKLGDIWEGGLIICRELSRDSTRYTANKHSLELCASTVHVILDGWSVWCVSVAFLAGQVLGNW